jgi:hypothetical protein
LDAGDVVELGLGLSAWMEAELWKERNWTQRVNSSQVGLVYDSRKPWMSVGEDGWMNLLDRNANSWDIFSVSAPINTLHYISGIGGGQRFGMEVFTPTSNNDQLHVDYWRNNVRGLYQNEGLDGHDLIVNYRALDSLSRTERWMLDVKLFDGRFGTNAGLENPVFFEGNYPGIRSNYAVNYRNGELSEYELSSVFTYVLSDELQLITDVGRKRWATENDQDMRAYYWDSTDVPTLRSSVLNFEDTTALVHAFGGFKLMGQKGIGFEHQISLLGGVEQFSSDVMGWDAIRLDSVQPTVDAFERARNAVVKVEANGRRDLDFKHGNVEGNVIYNGQVRLLGWNAGAYDFGLKTGLKNKFMIFHAGVDVRGGRKMHRWEGELVGFSYDLTAENGRWAHNSAWTDVRLGEKNFVEFEARYDQFTNYRYFMQDLGTTVQLWSGSLYRMEAGLGRQGMGWNGSLRGYTSVKTADLGMALPTWGAMTTLSYKGRIGDRFEWHSGIRLQAESAVFLPSYESGLPVWHLQEAVVAATYPWMEVFYDARIDSFTIGLKGLNILEGIAPYEYWAYGAVPMTDRWVQLSARWTLFN